MELKREEEVKRVVMWKHWILGFLCLVLSCFHLVCVGYAFCMVSSSLDAIEELEPSKRPFLPLKEMAVIGAIVLTFFFSPVISCLAMINMLYARAAEKNVKALFPRDASVDFLVLERQFQGTDLYAEAASDLTQFTFKFCADVYAVALLQVSFNIFQVWGLFLAALIIIFSGTLASFFGKCCM